MPTGGTRRGSGDGAARRLPAEDRGRLDEPLRRGATAPSSASGSASGSTERTVTRAVFSVSGSPTPPCRFRGGGLSWSAVGAATRSRVLKRSKAKVNVAPALLVVTRRTG